MSLRRESYQRCAPQISLILEAELTHAPILTLYFTQSAYIVSVCECVSASVSPTNSFYRKEPRRLYVHLYDLRDLHFHPVETKQPSEALECLRV